jgi:hypothetical protein
MSSFGVLAASLIQHMRGDEDGNNCRDGEQQEDPTPAKKFGDDAADDQTAHGADRGHGGQQRHGTRATWSGKRLATRARAAGTAAAAPSPCSALAGGRIAANVACLHPAGPGQTQRPHSKLITVSQATAGPQKLQKLSQMVYGLDKSHGAGKIATTRQTGLFVPASDDLEKDSRPHS